MGRFYSYSISRMEQAANIKPQYTNNRSQITVEHSGSIEFFFPLTHKLALFEKQTTNNLANGHGGRSYSICNRRLKRHLALDFILLVQRHLF